jgi:hypothetical protein
MQEHGPMNLDRTEKRSLDRLAALEGEIWARRLLDQLTTWDGPVQREWPGRLEDARALAAALVEGPKTQEALAIVIHQRAQMAWGKLVEGRNGTSPTPL